LRKTKEEVRLPYRIVEPKIQQKVQSKDGPIETKEQDCAIAGLAFKCIHHTSIEERQKFRIIQALASHSVVKKWLSLELTTKLVK